MNWSKLWPYAHTGWGWTVAIVTIGFTVYRGPRIMFETWGWYMEKLFDCHVLEILESNVQTYSGGMAGKRVFGMPVEMKTFVEKTRMSEKRILACLQRLKRKKQAQQIGKSWKFPDN